MNTFRKAYSIVGALLILEYLTQFYLIASALFTLAQAYHQAQGHPTSKAIYAAFKNADSIAAIHVANGYDVIPITTLVLIGLAFAARLSRKTIGLTVLLAVLLLLQMALVWLKIPSLTALHGINAVVLLSLASWLTWTNWAWRVAPQPKAAQPVEAVATPVIAHR